MHVRKKPVEVTALQWTGDNEAFVRSFVANDSNIRMRGDNNIDLYNTEEKAWIPVALWHFIIKGIKGEFYPCSPEVFNRTYDIITPQP